METDAEDLSTQYETLLDQVWKCEQEWRLDDRITLAVGRGGRLPEDGPF
jgi:hypothetical protein